MYFDGEGYTLFPNLTAWRSLDLGAVQLTLEEQDMALDSTKWQYRTDKSIRYIGGAHGTATANYISVYELHRWLQDLADDASSSSDDYLDITIPNPSDKKFTTIIELLNTT